MQTTEKENQMLMFEEMRRTNELIINAFKACISNFSNKVLVPSEKKCIKEYYQQTNHYNEIFLQALGKASAKREAMALYQLLKK